jgi:hypothetical protein
MAQAVSRRPIIPDARVPSHVSSCEICDQRSGTGTGSPHPPVLRFSPVSIIPPVLHTDLHIHFVLTRRTNCEAWKHSKSNAVSEIGEHWTENDFHFFLSIAGRRFLLRIKVGDFFFFRNRR